MKETVAIESPRCAVELRRAEVDGGRESHVDGADGISDTVHPWGPREPSDQTPPAQISRGLRSAAWSFRSARQWELARRDAAA